MTYASERRRNWMMSFREFMTVGVSKAIAAFLLLFCLLSVMAEDGGWLHKYAFQASVTVKLDPDGAYDRLLERFGKSGADEPFGPIDAALGNVPHREAAEDDDHPTERPRDLEAMVQPDGKSLTFFARSPGKAEARRLAETTARDFAEQRNAAATGWLRRWQIRTSIDVERSSAVDRVEGSIRDEIEALTAGSAKLEAFTADDVTFEDLSTVDNSSNAMQLLLERAVLQSDLRATAGDAAEQDAVRGKINQIHQELGQELLRLAGQAAEKADRLRADIDDEDSDRSFGDDITALIEQAGPYAVADGDAEILTRTSFDFRVLLGIGLVSLLGGASVWRFAGRDMTLSDWPEQQHTTAGREKAYGAPAWPLGDSHSSEKEEESRQSTGRVFRRPPRYDSRRDDHLRRL